MDGADNIVKARLRIAELEKENKALREEVAALHHRPRELQRALSVADIASMKKQTLKLGGAWRAAFGEPERCGVWFIWGNSGNGKTNFTLQLCLELTKFGRVAYNSLEEGDSLSMRESILRSGLLGARGRFVLLHESMADLSERLSRRKGPDFVVIDSFQYTQMSYRAYIEFKERHRDKTLIFVSHADGNRPSGRAAKSVVYDASLKIWVEGYKAFSKGRYFGPAGEYVIWPERAAVYWGAGV